MATVEEKVARLRQLGYSDAEITQGLIRNGLVQQAPVTKGNIFTHALPTLGGILGGIAGVPGAIPGIIAGSAAGSGLGKVAQNVIEEEPVTKGIGKEIALGAVGAGVGEGLGLAVRGAGAVLRGGSMLPRVATEAGTQTATRAASRIGAEAASEQVSRNALQQLGIATRKHVINPMIPHPGASAFADEAEMIQRALKYDKGILGKSAEGYRELSSTVYPKISEEVRAIVRQNPKQFNLAKLKKQAEVKAAEFIGEESTPAAVRSAKQLIKSTIDESLKLKGAKGLGEDILDIKIKSNEGIGPIFRKLRAGTPLTPKERGKLAVWKTIDDALREAYPEAKELLLDQSALQELALGLDEAAKQKGNLLGFKFPAPISNAYQAGIDTLGKATYATGTATQVAGKPTVGQLLARISQPQTQQAQGQVQGMVPATPQSLPSMLSGQTAPQPTGQYTEEQIRRALLWDAQHNKGRGAATIKSLRPTTASQKPKTEQQVAREDIANISTIALNYLQQNPTIKAGMVSGPLEQVKARFNKADPTTYQFQTLIANLQATINKARAGTTLTKTEQAQLDKYAPRDTDSMQQLMVKLLLLSSYYGGAGRQGGPIIANDQPYVEAAPQVDLSQFEQ